MSEFFSIRLTIVGVERKIKNIKIIILTVNFIGAKLCVKKKLSKAEYDYIHDEESQASEKKATPVEEKVAWFKLFGYKQTWAFVFGKFMTDGIWWFFLFCYNGPWIINGLFN